MIPKQLRLFAFFFIALLGVQAQTAVPVFGGNAQHTANYRPAAQNLNAVRWSTSIDLGSIDLGSVDLASNGTSTHYGAPVISALNTVFVPVKTATNGFQVNALSGNTGVPIYTLSTDYIAPGHNPTPSYSPALATGPSGTRLYYAGAGGSVYYIGNPDARPGSAPVQQVFYGLSSYQANRAGFNSSVFINTPITTDNNGNIFFGFAVQGTAPAPLNTTQSGFARIDPSGKATYVLAGVASGDSNIGRDSPNSAPALSDDQSTLYVVAKAANTESYGYLLGLDSITLVTKYKTVLRDPVSGNYAAISDDSAASPMVAPDGDVYLGVTGNPQDNHQGFLLHFNADLTLEKVPGALGRDFTPAIVPATMVTSYSGSSSYLIFSRYNDAAGEDGGQGVNRIVLLDPNSTQLDPHPSANSLSEMREVLSASSVTPDTYYVTAGFPFAVSEWSASTAAVNPATNSIYVTNADGHIYRWDLSSNSLSQGIPLTASRGAAHAPLTIGPDGAIYTINAGSLFAAGDATGIAVSLKSSSPDLRNAVAGEAVTFTAAVVNSPGAEVAASGAEVAASGTVTFRDTSFQNAAALSVTLGTARVDATGHASLVTSSLQAGAHFITASYNGSANAGSATMVQLIHASATAVTLASSLSSSDRDRGRGATTTLTATVTPSAALISGVPTGMVAFTDENNNVVAQIPLSAGAASLTTIALRAGTHVFGAVYSSDGTFAAGTGTLAEASRTSNATTFRATPVAASAVRPRAITGGALSGVGDYSQNPANLTLEGTADWIHWGPPCTDRKASAGSASQAVSQLSDFTLIVPATNQDYQTDARRLSWTDGYQTSTPCTTLPVSSANYPNGNPNGEYVLGVNNGFSFTAPADTTVRTLVVHAGGFSAVGQLTAQLSDGSAPEYVDMTNQITGSYDRNYVLTYKAASAGQTLKVSWVEVTDLASGAGNVDLSAAALSLFTGTIMPVSGTESAAVATAFAPLQVTVTDANGSPVSGVMVTFVAPTPAPNTGSFSSGATATALTNSNGVASAPAFTANTVTGSYYVTASVPGVANTAEFILTNVAGPPVSMTPVNLPPYGYNAVVNTPFSPALQAQVKDFYGNLVSGATVTFSDTPASGQAGAVFATGTTATAMTNAFGIAFAPTLTANSFQGHYNVGATVASVTISPLYFLNNTPGGNGFLAGAGTSSSAAVNLTAVGTSDWIHWGDSNTGTGLNRKATGGSQISDFTDASTMVGQDRTPGPAKSALAGAQSLERRNSERVTKLHSENMGPYNNDPRPMSWSDGAPLANSTNNANGYEIDYGTYTVSGSNGFYFTAPADTTARTLTVYVGGTNSGGTLVAHLSDGSAPDFVDTTPLNASSYDRNYTLTYSAGSAMNNYLTVTWTMTSGTGNVTLSGAAVSLGIPSTITTTAGNGQGAVANAVFGTQLQATVKDLNGNALSGVLVTFEAPGTGATAAFSGSSGTVVTTDMYGIATAPALKANGVIGSYTVIATLAGAQAPAKFTLYNVIAGGSMSGSGTSFDSTITKTTANLTAAGTVDWVHWGSTLNRKNGVSPQISAYNTVVGPQTVLNYPNDSRTLTWTDGTPTAIGSDTSGLYINFVGGIQAGFSFTVPADTIKRTLNVYVGGYVTTGMLTAHLSDQSAADFVDTTASFPNSFDSNYTLTYNAASAGQMLTITWVTAMNSGNVTLNGAALSLTPPTIAAVASTTPQNAPVNTPFATALQAVVNDANNNPLPGATVTFTAQTNATSGASATFAGLPSATAITSPMGIATAPTLTANGQLGNYTVTATVPTAVTQATFNLNNYLGGGSLSGSGNSLSTAVNLTAVGTADWVHWGDSPSNLAAVVRKSGVSPQISSNNMMVGSKPGAYPDDARALSWSDGTPVAGNSSDTNGVDVYYGGYTLTVPADTNKRTLSVYLGGYDTGGTLTASLSDSSAPNWVDTTLDSTSNGPAVYDRNYTLTFSAASPNQTLTVSWVSASGNGNVSLSGAALSILNALTPQTITFGPLSMVNLGAAPFPVNATASSGLPVSFTSTTTGVCTVAGNTVTIAGPGLCSITASQAGNSTYAAAVPVTQSFTVDAIFRAGSFTLAQGASISLGTLNLVMQNDGNLVLYQGGSAIWYTGTSGQSCGASNCVAIFQNDGNFVVYNGQTPLWSSGTFGNPGAELVLSGQLPQLEIIGTSQNVLWTTFLEFSPGNLRLSQGGSVSVGSFSLVMQNDGNLVLYQQNGPPVWSTGTFGQNCGASQCFAVFQADGSLVVYNGSTPLWTSRTSGNSGGALVFTTQAPQLQIIGANQAVLWTDVSFGAGNFALSQGASLNFGFFSLIMQSDGNLVLYRQGSPAVWNTGTSGQNCGAGKCITIFQGDGNLVVYNGSTPLWSSGTFGNSGANLVFSSQAPQMQIISNNSVLWVN